MDVKGEGESRKKFWVNHAREGPRRRLKVDKHNPKNNEARSVGDPACGDCSAVMGALYGVTLIGLTTIILMVDASTALPLSDVDVTPQICALSPPITLSLQAVAIEAQPGVVRTLLSAPVSLDSMLVPHAWY